MLLTARKAKVSLPLRFSLFPLLTFAREPSPPVPNESGDGCKPDPDAPTGEKGTWCPIPCWDGQGNPPITHDWCETNCGTGHLACSASGVLEYYHHCQDCSTIKWPNSECNRIPGGKNEVRCHPSSLFLL